MLGDVVAQARHYGLVVAFFLAVGLWVVCDGWETFDTKEVAYGREELARKLRSVVGQQELWYPVGYEPVFEEHVRDVR